jgi:hypothetical protein
MLAEALIDAVSLGQMDNVTILLNKCWELNVEYAFWCAAYVNAVYRRRNRNLIDYLKLQLKLRTRYIAYKWLRDEWKPRRKTLLII